ncbi:MAG: hypothetical protein AB2598_02235 [Candidatus Thiodiazotropha sp.]
MEYLLPILIAVVALISIFITPKANNDRTFFQGLSPAGAPPSLLTLTFSQVTTWIFARSLMNAEILGFYYGLWPSMESLPTAERGLQGRALSLASFRIDQGH